MGIFDSVVNFASQQFTNMFNLHQQNRAWNREDEAVQRRVADLKAAGLSPTLAAGSAASSMGPIRAEAPKIGSLSLLDAKAALQQLRLGEAGIEKTRAEIDLIRQQKLRSQVEARGQEIANAFAESTNPLLHEQRGLETEIMRATKQARIDQVLRNAEGAGLDNTLKKLDGVLKGMEVPQRVLDAMSQILSDQLKREQISGIKAEIAVKAATVDMLAEREKGYRASADRDRALTELIKTEADAFKPGAAAGRGVGRALDWLFKERK